MAKDSLQENIPGLRVLDGHVDGDCSATCFLSVTLVKETIIVIYFYDVQLYCYVGWECLATYTFFTYIL